MKLYNTLSRKVEDFKPLNDKKVNFFVCGPTVYDLSHLGHAKTYIQMDVLARTLQALGYDVFYLQNITDIDDKIIARAAEKGVTWKELGDEFEAKYQEDMKALNNTSVTQYAKATNYIDNIIRQVQTLIDKGHAYKIDDGIYFEISTFKDYGKLSGRTEVQENDAQSRIDQSEGKRGWNDFCLWKFSKPGEPVWEAPFGKGRPGWHIEDTAITEHFFGPQYDIHGGAVDLIFPHHEAEITQMESASGKKPFVQIWTHVGFLNINSAKMAKSTGNFFTIRDVLAKGYDSMAVRLFMLQTHYRSPINFTWENLDAAGNRLKNWQALADLRWQTVDDNSKNIDWATPENFIKEKLAEDLNTPEAITTIDHHADIVDYIPTDGLDGFVAFLKFVDNAFGLNLSQRKDIDDSAKKLLQERQTARDSKDWTKSDQLRDQLKEQEIGVRDTEHGQIWYRI